MKVQTNLSNEQIADKAGVLAYKLHKTPKGVYCPDCGVELTPTDYGKKCVGCGLRVVRYPVHLDEKYGVEWGEEIVRGAK